MTRKISEQLFDKVKSDNPNWDFSEAYIIRQPSIKIVDIPRWFIRNIRLNNGEIIELMGDDTMSTSLKHKLVYQKYGNDIEYYHCFIEDGLC